MAVLTDQEAAAEAAVAVAVQLAFAVRYEGPTEVEDLIGEARAGCGLEALVVALAAMVPEDRSPRELLRWLEEKIAAQGCDPALDKSGPRVRSLHGTRSRAEAGCGGAACQAARTAYYADRHRQQQQLERAADLDRLPEHLEQAS